MNHNPSGDAWANWLLAGSCVFSFAILLLFREHYRRMTVDMGSESSSSAAIND